MRARAMTVGGIGKEVLLVASRRRRLRRRPSGDGGQHRRGGCECPGGRAVRERARDPGWEHAAQSLILGSVTLTTFANWVYIFGHWPVIIAAAAVLYWEAARPLPHPAECSSSSRA